MTHHKKALIIVDIQNDFVPGGSLPVKEGNQIIPLLNQLLSMDFDAKIATKDWHPANHGSFAANHPNKKLGDQVDLYGLKQILWPIHCVQNTFGADFVKEFDATKCEKIFTKGSDPTIDSYSTFFDNGRRKSTGLDVYLRNKKITDVYIAGLATDYCIKYSVLDALALGYNTYVITEACRGVNLQETDTAAAYDVMSMAGAHLVSMRDVEILLSSTPKHPHS